MMSKSVYDFVVVGGGSSGCAAAGELAARGFSVALLEVGDAAESHPESLRADGYKEAFINDALMHERFTTRQSECGGRRLFAGTGRGVGGSGSINAMVYTRGSREDYEAFGDGWRWPDVVPHFEDLEQRLEPRRRAPTDFNEACISAAEEQGFRRKADLNDGDLSGVLGYEWMNFKGEQRRNSYVAFIRDPRPANLQLFTGVEATRLEFEPGATPRVVGVHVKSKEGPAFFEARHEVLLCLGALATPVLLLRSGVGPRTELRGLGITSVADAPSVGRNLHDHPNVTLFFRGSADLDAAYPQLYGFHRMAEGKGPSDCCFVFYPARSSFREGLIRMLPAMLLPGDQGPKKRLLRGSIETLFKSRLVNNFVERMWGIVVILGKPKSRGTVRLGSADPEAAVHVDPAYLTHPDDVAILMRGIDKARQIAGSSAMGAYRGGELIPGPLGRIGKDQAAADREFLRQNLMTTYHYAGTARLGDDADAVVDRRLLVKSVRGLRIADASVMPETPVSALNAPSMMIGLRAAKFAAEDHSTER